MIKIDQENIFLKRVLIILKTEGIKGFFKHIKDRLLPKESQIHLFVLTFKHMTDSDSSAFPTGLDPAVVRVLKKAQQLLKSLEFKQLTMVDNEEIDELTAIDPWNIPKRVTLEKLQDDWHCYVAKYKGRIVASDWAKSGPEFYEPFLKRSFTLADNEVYGWRAFCVPDFRGRGVIPWLKNSIINHLALTEGIKSHIGLVRVENETMWRSLVQFGWTIDGRVGFVEAFGIRLHYIWGRKAFSATRKRFFIQLQNHN